jgi:hypothetical protein
MDGGHPGIGSLTITENDELSHMANLFKPPRKEISLISGTSLSVRPIGKDSKGPFTFCIPNYAPSYIQLSSARLWAECRIVHADGSAIKEDDFSVVNMFPSSLFSEIRVELNGHPLSELSTSNANIKNYIENVLTYGRDARESHMQTSMFVMDTANQFDTLGDANEGYTARKKFVEKSRKFDWMCPISHDFLQIDRLIPPGVEIRIELTRARDSFSIMTDNANPDYIVVFDDMKLFYRTLELTPHVMDFHSSQITKTPATYPVNRTVMKNFNIAQGLSNDDSDNLFGGAYLPKSVIVGMMTSSSYNGSYKCSSYNFQHFDCNFACLKVKGVTYPADPYTPKFGEKLISREFSDMFYNIGIHHENVGNLMTRALFCGGLYLQPYDLSPCLCNSFHYHEPRAGDVGISLKFGKPLEEAVTIIIMATYDGEVYLDQYRNVATSFGTVSRTQYL